MSLQPLDPEPPGRQIALMVTRRCNMSCGHCSVESGPLVRGEPSDAELLSRVRAAADAGVRAINLTGGEPMLRGRTVLRLIRECRRLGVTTSMTSNGFWGRTRGAARRHLRALARAGLGGLVLSYDRYHAEFQGADPTLHIAAAADDVGLPVRVSLVRGTDEENLSALVSRLDGGRSTRLRVYDLQPVGRARTLPLAFHRAEVEGFCTAAGFPAVGDDGRVMACNGPAYFEPRESPLVAGSLAEEPLADILDRYRRDPILDTIRTEGPAGLRDELRRIPAFAGFPFRERYAGMCDLCHHITRDAAAVAALRERLSHPGAAARRLARWQVIDGNRRGGTLDAAYVNGAGSCRMFLGAALDPAHRFEAGADHLLGRADLDWRALAAYLNGCGLARPLVPAMSDPRLVRWAPRFFRDALQRQAIADAMRELVQRDVIHRIAEVLEEVGTDAVLLKGAAFLVRQPAGMPHRATTDVDAFVEPAHAAHVRSGLLARGFEGARNEGASTFQHLAPVSFQGVAVEIHIRLMAPSWGLPEPAMLAGARRVEGLPRVKVLGPEGLILHAAVHQSASFFSFGLKTAWDILAVVRSGEGVHWPALADLADTLRAPRAFWIPVRELALSLGLPVPADFLRRAPSDAGTRRVGLVARHRLFTGSEGLFDLDALTKAGLTLLLHDRWGGRARYLDELVRWRAARPGTWGAAARRARRADILRQPWRQYLRYRRAIGRERPSPLPD